MALRNIIGAIAILIFALWYGDLATVLPKRDMGDGSPGPQFFPYLITIMMLFFSGILLIQGLRGIRGISGIADLLPKDKEYNLMKPIGGILLIGLYFGMLKLFGFLWCTPFFFAGLMWINGERRPKIVLGLSIVVPLFLYFLFRDIFLLPLPQGSLLG
ncbi:MAG: tripartite tricarboxylate transporter TctB family protein [Rhodospirillales bacterium]|nr:tripartite tricarboxylate transporter TctB family protein [Rhodospirillales bacterium]